MNNKGVLFVMKKRMILAVLIVGLAGLALAGCAVRPNAEGTSLPAVCSQDIEQKSITVSAQGKVTAKPDVAYVTVGVTTQDKDMQLAQDKNAQIMNAMAQALKSAGLVDDDIKTVQYNAYPIYDYTDGTNKIVNYEVNNQIELTIKEIDRVGEYIDIAVNNGANTTNSISFGILDQQAIYNEALKLAVEAAKAKADVLAAAGGVKVTGTLHISENTSGGEIVREYAEAEMADKASGSTPISSGNLDIEAGVTVVYEIE